MQSKVTIAMPILSRSAEEADHLIDSVGTLAKLKIPMVAADGGSHPELIGFLKSIPHLTLLSAEEMPGGLVSQARSAIQKAAEQGSERILYTEPDKKWFFENRLIEFIEFGQTKEDAGMVLASRSKESFGTFPPVQQVAERLTNELICETLKTVLDTVYGPFLFPTQFARYLAGIPGDLGWGWRTFLMTMIHRSGAELVPYWSDFPCPEHQRSENDSRTQIYRIEQMVQNVRALALALKAPVS
jgi:hypothetical protein